MHKYKTFTFLAAITLASMWLCVSAYNARTQLNIVQKRSLGHGGENAVRPYVISFNPVASFQTSLLSEQALQSDASELRARLGFMVFTKERAETQSALKDVVQQQLNRTPFSSGSWRDLVFVQQGLGVADAEVKATFLVAKKLSQWNVNERIVLLNRCVNEYQRLNLISPDLCAGLLANLPMQDNVKRLSHLMGIEHSRLLDFLRKIDSSVTGDVK